MFQNISEEKGVSLIMAILTGMFLSILGYVTISTVIIDNRIAVKHLQSTRAFWLAESGIEVASRWLRYQDPPPGGIVPFVKYNQEPAGTGTYTVTIDPDDGNTSSYLKKYKVFSTGEVDNVVRKIEIEIEMTTFNKYAYLTGDEGGTIWFTTGDLIEGPLHSNDQISIVGSPVFMGKVTSTASSFNQGSPFNPDFQEGYQLGVPPVIFPTQQDLIDNYWAMNTEPPDLIIDARFGKDASIEFNADGTLTYNVWHWENGNKVYDIQDAVVNIADLNGLVYVKGDVRIKGTLNGEVTVISTKNMYITDDIVYQSSDSNGKPLPGSDDVLGLISLKNIVIADNAPNRDNVIINAAILSLDQSFTVQNYTSGEPRGNLTIWGSLSQKVRGPVGTFGWWGYTGYKKDYHYDNRFVSTPPPYFPVTGQYHFNYWKEVTD
jgi:cytoskeletal protein CcmA (bactofilin family)